MLTAVLPMVPGYEIREELARGGGGIVYRAWQERLDRLVAIKVIRPECLLDPEAARRFQREAKAAARLSHPHIVGIFDCGEADGTHYLVMEYIDGIDLAKLVCRRGPLPIAQVCDFMRQAACGLAHAHEKGLVHRDIKPGNLMITGNGERGTGKEDHTDSPFPVPRSPLVKILDFGLACFSGAEADGGLLGTPDYLAPEQIEDAGAADIRADLYGLGCSFYYLLTGRVPFPDGSVAYKLERQRSCLPVPIRRFRPRVAPEVIAIVGKLMAKQPSARFQTPVELVEALDRLSGRGRAAAVPAGLPFGSGDAATIIHPVDAAALSDDGVRRFEGHEDAVCGVAFTPDGRQVISAGRDGAVRTWQVESGEERARATVAGLAGLALAPDGSWIALAGKDGTIRLWDPTAGKEARQWAGHQGGVLGVAISPDGRRLLSGGRDQVVRLWSAATGKEIRRIGGTVAERHWGSVLAVAIAPDGQRALSASADRTVRLWDLLTGREVRCLRDHAAPVRAVAFAANGRQALAADGSQVAWWDLETGQLLRRLAGHERTIRALALSADGRWAATASDDTSVRLWETATGKEVQRHTGHRGLVHAVAFAPEGRSIASGGADRTVCLWNVQFKIATEGTEDTEIKR